MVIWWTDQYNDITTDSTTVTSKDTRTQFHQQDLILSLYIMIELISNNLSKIAHYFQANQDQDASCALERRI